MQHLFPFIRRNAAGTTFVCIRDSTPAQHEKKIVQLLNEEMLCIIHSIMVKTCQFTAKCKNDRVIALKQQNSK